MNYYLSFINNVNLENLFNVIYFQICNSHINYSMIYHVFLLTFLLLKQIS